MTNPPVDYKDRIPPYARAAVHAYLLLYGVLIISLIIGDFQVGGLIKGLVSTLLWCWMFYWSFRSVLFGPAKWAWFDERYRAAMFLNACFYIGLFAFFSDPLRWIALAVGAYCLGMIAVVTYRARRRVHTHA